MVNVDVSHVTLNWVVCELFSDWPLCINGNYCLDLNYVRVERELFDIELFGCIGVWVCESGSTPLCTLHIY